MLENLFKMSLKIKHSRSVYIIAPIFKNDALFTLNNETQSYLIFIFRNKNKTKYTLTTLNNN